MTIQMSKNVKDIDNRIDKMPTFYYNMLMAVRKGDAVKFIDQYKKNIRQNRLNLHPLSPKTIKQKERKGYQKPDTPLYGLGDMDNKTYINMFLLREIKKGWKAYPRWAKHHEADLQLRQLFEIHEYGRTIVRGKTLIRIEPRPVAWLTYKQILSKVKKRESSKKVKKAIMQYIKNGDRRVEQEIINHSRAIGKEYEEGK